MFDIGFWEILIITLVALLVVGPERLPGLAREIGRFVGKARRFVNSVRSDIEQELQTDELRKMLKGQEQEIQELKSMMQETETSLREDLKETEQTLRENLDDTADDRKKLDPEARPGAEKAKPAETGSGKSDAAPPRIQRVPVQNNLDGDLLTDAPKPQPAAADKAGTRNDEQVNKA
ncbi:Twin-arginine translocation protein TatB [Thioalkalivibrio nitratireducens DSM 14787]|uniref:Sec-independent protein translocase protein TatB n=1 Tax=Thioalkalivibrio nitratireducens (strain DSM 14787 / UNIQEM 213 / ALEN2) TaxID=1255043 RepID=L0DTS9_THIND|nr:Sec-independent protein translocase protein TatB [Thioalkalivibrio nitratireducens]AGA31781.1 Twin-arginine translocation protein TatB [Thioalkalivibrio nitratireducens DSM 14787]